MKKAILILGVALSLFACNKNEGKSESFKTAYIDTAEILEKYENALLKYLGIERYAILYGVPQ